MKIRNLVPYRDKPSVAWNICLVHKKKIKLVSWILIPPTMYNENIPGRLPRSQTPLREILRASCSLPIARKRREEAAPANISWRVRTGSLEFWWSVKFQWFVILAISKLSGNFKSKSKKKKKHLRTPHKMTINRKIIQRKSTDWLKIVSLQLDKTKIVVVTLFVIFFALFFKRDREHFLPVSIEL